MLSPTDSKLILIDVAADILIHALELRKKANRLEVSHEKLYQVATVHGMLEACTIIQNRINAIGEPK